MRVASESHAAFSRQVSYLHRNKPLDLTKLSETHHSNCGLKM